MTPAVTFIQLPNRPGLREYEVYDLGLRVGIVSRRRGGWWRSYDMDGHSHGSWFQTRREAADSLIRKEAHS